MQVFVFRPKDCDLIRYEVYVRTRGDNKEESFSRLSTLWNTKMQLTISLIRMG